MQHILSVCLSMWESYRMLQSSSQLIIVDNTETIFAKHPYGCRHKIKPPFSATIDQA